MGTKKINTKSIMIQGTGSHVGKSIVTAAICRILKQDGYRVCPFKSQNMALNSCVTASGGEMGRAQVVQAEACGLEPEVYMNPILIKPTADTQAQIIFMGKVVKNMSAAEYNEKKIYFLNKIKEILDDLKKKFDVIVIEGAGSPAEVNLLKNDIVNMRTAEIAGSPVILVGDIDKGGVFASFYGTVKLLPRNYRKYIRGLLVNKFRGDIKLLEPGNDYIAKKLRIPVIGTIPYFRDIYIEEEDSVNLEREKEKKSTLDFSQSDKRDNLIRIGVIYLPHISNFTDFNALELEKNVSLVYVKKREDLKLLSPHLIIIPGSKSTISDLLYLRRTGMEEEVKRQYRKGACVIGICGGYQILGEKIIDRYKTESAGANSVDGMGLLGIYTEFLQDKNTCQVNFKFNPEVLNIWRSLGLICQSDVKDKYASRYVSEDNCNQADMDASIMKGYEIHMGISKIVTGKQGRLLPLFRTVSRGGKPASSGSGDNEGIAYSSRENSGMVIGTYIHGIFDNFIFRKMLLELIRSKNNIKVSGNFGDIKNSSFRETEIYSYQNFKEEQYDKLASLFRKNMDMELLYRILRTGL